MGLLYHILPKTSTHGRPRAPFLPLFSTYSPLYSIFRPLFISFIPFLSTFPQNFVLVLHFCMIWYSTARSKHAFPPTRIRTASQRQAARCPQHDALRNFRYCKKQAGHPGLSVCFSYCRYASSTIPAMRRVRLMMPSSRTALQPLLITTSVSPLSGSTYRLQTMPSLVP